jgi:hypothetical protein
MKIIKLLIISLTIFTVGASINPGMIRAETSFEQQMRTAMEADTKALGERIVTGTNPPLTYAQMRTLADKLSAKYKAAGKRLNPRELMTITGVSCKPGTSDNGMSQGYCEAYYLDTRESFFRYFTEPAPVLSYKFRLRYFEANGKAFDIYSARINFTEDVEAPAATQDAETKKARREREEEMAKKEAADRAHKERVGQALDTSSPRTINGMREDVFLNDVYGR